MEINSASIVGDVVKANYKTAQVFERNRIDFCCGGRASLDEACRKSGTDLGQLLSELESQASSGDPDSAYIDGLAPDELCDYIEKRHHAYVRGTIPFLSQKLDKLCKVHGSNHPELFEVRDLFHTAAGNLAEHMQKEERDLFPEIRRMTNSDKNRPVAGNVLAGAAGQLSTLEDEHRAEGERFEKISALSGGYTCPPDGCNTFRVTWKTLSEFEQDLHRHIHLENNVLFGKVRDLDSHPATETN